MEFFQGGTAFSRPPSNAQGMINDPDSKGPSLVYLRRGFICQKPICCFWNCHSVLGALKPHLEQLEPSTILQRSPTCTKPPSQNSILAERKKNPQLLEKMFDQTGFRGCHLVDSRQDLLWKDVMPVLRPRQERKRWNGSKKGNWWNVIWTGRAKA